jgi:cyclopropane fatty-acyl-phospholipid synthase-like methyltransferase
VTDEGRLEGKKTFDFGCGGASAVGIALKRIAHVHGVTLITMQMPGLQLGFLRFGGKVKANLD